MAVPPIAPNMLARIMCDGRAATPAPRDPARERAWAELRAGAPLRAKTEQQDAAHLPLFVAANEPRLF